MKRLFPNRKYDINDRSSWVLWRWCDLYTTARESIYLTRLYIVRTILGAIQLHWIRQPDSDPAPHDHPAPFFSIVLWGHYWEEYQTGFMRYTFSQRKVTWFNWKLVHTAHRIYAVSERPCVTLVFVGRMPKIRRGPKQSWGFIDNGKWVYWRDYIGSRPKN